jgi:hypothetical protein
MGYIRRGKWIRDEMFVSGWIILVVLYLQMSSRTCMSKIRSCDTMGTMVDVSSSRVASNDSQ